MPAPLSDLAEMLATLDVVVRPDLFVFAAVPAGSPAASAADAVITEEEAVTLVLREGRAREHGLATGTRFAWLTLTVHSSLESVGLTAAVAGALAASGISCNVLAGFHHDHLLVPERDRARAVDVLRALRHSGSNPRGLDPGGS